MQLTAHLWNPYHREGDYKTRRLQWQCWIHRPISHFPRMPRNHYSRARESKSSPAPHVWKMVETVPSSKVLQKYLHKLANTLDPVVISTALYAEELISERVWEQAQLEGASYDRCLKVLGALVRQVKASPASFDKFCSILEDQDVTRDLGRELKGNFYLVLETVRTSVLALLGMSVTHLRVYQGCMMIIVET